MFYGLFVYLLGGVTFLPLVVLGIYIHANWDRLNDPQSREASEPLEEKESTPASVKGIRGYNSLKESGIAVSVDDINASGWVMFSPVYMPIGEPYEQTPMQDTVESARSSLDRIANSSTTTNQLGGTIPYKALLKLPKYWAVVRGDQLQLYLDDSGDRTKIVDCFELSNYIVTLWPQKLQEFELFYKKYPLCLISRTGQNGVVSLDLDQRNPPSEAVYFYCDNPTTKEDLYFALIQGSRVQQIMDGSSGKTPSLGPRDPVFMARPIIASRMEKQELQSKIWRTDGPLETQWLNALLGRLFLAVKDSRMIERYLKNKFAYKLKSASNSYIDEIAVTNVDCGSSAPFINAVKLRELTPDGNLEVEVGISYSGGFTVTLATLVKLAVGSFKAGEIPVELACKILSLEGTLLFRIKPAPSSRMWYAFETMPKIDLHIEPAVYDTQLSYSFVTNYISKLILDTVKETVVMPYMDDWSFYDTSPDFYRGGIWENGFPDPTPVPMAGAEELADLPPAETEYNTLRRRPATAPATAATTTEVPDVVVPPLREPVPSTSFDSVGTASSSNSTVRRFSAWVKKKRSSQSLRTASAETPPRGAVAPGLPEMPELAVPSTPPRAVSQSPSLNSLLAPTSPSVSAVTREVAAVDAPRLSRSPVRRKPVPVRRRPLPATAAPITDASDSDSDRELAPSELAPPEPLGVDTSQAPEPALAPVASSLEPEAQLDEPSQDDVVHSLKQAAPSELRPPLVTLNSSPSLAPSSASVIVQPESRDWGVTLDSESRHLRKASLASSAASIAAPSLPPRRRKYVVLSNVPPEPDRD